MIIPDPADLLRDLVRVDTTNPPGNESAAAALLRPLLEAAGASVEEYSAVPGRSNLVATLPATSAAGATAPPLVLISHLDVVAADGTEWTHPPFAGETVDGVIYGRGTLDTKQLTVMETVAMLRAATSMAERCRPIILIASADEEAGSSLGMAWLAGEHPELFNRQGTIVISEGGGFPIISGDQVLYPITSGEKGAAVFHVKVTGEGGHGSKPSADPVLSKIASIVDRLAELRFDKSESPVLAEMAREFSALRGEDNDKLCESLVGYASEVSLNINRIDAGNRVNVLPSFGDMEIELRFPPGYSREQVLKTVSPAFSGDGLEWEMSRFEDGFISAVDGDFFRLVGKVLTGTRPGATLVPVLALGRTDGRFFNSAACDVYGISPVLDDSGLSSVLKQVHGKDERISEESVRWGTDLISELVREYLEG